MLPEGSFVLTDPVADQVVGEDTPLQRDVVRATCGSDAYCPNMAEGGQTYRNVAGGTRRWGYPYRG